MIFFEIIRENLTTLGVGLSQPSIHLLFQIGRIRIVFVLLVNFFSFTLYALYEANDFAEYINSIFTSSILLFALLVASNCIWNTEHFHRLLNNIERTIKTSKRRDFNKICVILASKSIMKCLNFIGIVKNKSKAIYIGADEKLKFWGKILDLCIVKITPVCIHLPSFVVSTFKYFSTSLGNEAFKLPFNQW